MTNEKWKMIIGKSAVILLTENLLTETDRPQCLSYRE